MNDGFQVDPEQVRRVAEVFAQEQETPSRLSATFLDADRADTGSASLNEQIRGLIELFDRVLTTLTDVLADNAEGLNQTAADYQTVDTEAAVNLDQVDGNGWAPSGSQPSGEAPVASRIRQVLG